MLHKGKGNHKSRLGHKEAKKPKTKVLVSKVQPKAKGMAKEVPKNGRKPRKPRSTSKLIEVKKMVAPAKLPVFEKHQVLKVLESGHTKTHFHCYMDNGTTMHVPKSKF